MSIGMMEAIAAFAVVALMPAGELLIELCAEGRDRRRQHLWWGIVALGTAPICLAAAAFTPPDLISMLIVLVPCEAVFILVVRAIVKGLTKKQEEKC